MALLTNIFGRSVNYSSGDELIGRATPHSPPQHILVVEVEGDLIHAIDALGRRFPPFHAWGWASLRKVSEGRRRLPPGLVPRDKDPAYRRR